jgi:hypothetical protein
LAEILLFRESAHGGNRRHLAPIAKSLEKQRLETSDQKEPFKRANYEDYGAHVMSKTGRFSSELIPVVILILSVLIFFSKIMFSGSPLFGSDFLLQFYPWKGFIYDNVWLNGALPFWNPHVFSGTPFIANIQASMFYPLSFLFYIIPTKYAYGYTIIFHCMLGAIFMYIFVRSLAIGKAGGLLAAVIFTYNGFFAAHLYAGHLTFVQNYVWIPLIFFYLYKFLNTSDFRYVVLSGLFIGIQILGGFPQIAFYTIFAAILFGTYSIGIRLRQSKRTTTLKLCAGMVTIVFLGFALAAVQVLPTGEFTRLSTRSGGVTYEFATSDSFDPVNFMTFVIPNFFGNPANNSYWKSTECWQFWELCAYAGIGPLLLLGFLKRQDQTRDVRFFFVLLLLLSLFLSLGRYNPLYRFVYHLPGFSHFRIPAQIIYLYIFSVSVLAGVGLTGLNRLESYPSSYKTMVGVCFLFFVMLIMAFFLWPLHFFYFVFKITGPSGLTPDLMPRLQETVRLSILTGAGLFVLVTALIHLHRQHRLGPTSFIVLLLFVITVDLWSFSSPMVQTTDLSVSEKKVELLKFLKTDSDIYRVVTMGNLFRPNEGLLYRYQNIQGYDPLILERYLSYLNKSQNLPECSEAVNINYVTRLNNSLIRMLNMKYGIRDDGHVLKLQDFMPRAFMVRNAIAVPSENVLDFMMSDDFNPAKMVVVEPQYQRFILPDDKREDFDGSCLITHYDKEAIRIKASANQAGYLVLSEIYYPGWEATVDGKKVPILRGNYLFRVVPLDRGTHEVQLRFVSWPFRIGAIVSVLTLVGSLLFIVRKWRTGPPSVFH